MSTPRAYEEVLLGQGVNALRLRPTLRAACSLERLHDGFPALLQKLDQLDTMTVRAVIEATATDAGAAVRFLHQAAGAPLREMLAWRAALVAVIAMLLPAPTGAAGRASEASTVMSWSELFNELFGLATGWLGWAPAEAWAATPQEIITSFEAHLGKLRILHGGAEEEQDHAGPTEEQRRQNSEEGLDPEFDREGLRALKARLAGSYA